MMERLTRAHYKASDGHYLVCSEMCEREDCTEECGHFDEAIERLAAYEDTGLSPQACVEAREIEAGLSAEDYSIHRMVELMRADKDGRLVVLPCKVGDTVWIIKQTFEGSHFEPKGFLLQDAFNIGKTVFLTCAEAKKALEGRKLQGIKSISVWEDHRRMRNDGATDEENQ